MVKDYVVYSSVAVGVTSTVIVAFSLPALTDVTGENAPTVAVQEAVAAQKSFCEQRLDGVNCVCFARRAGQVLAHDSPRAMGFAYADPNDLARDQGSDGC
ncbi:hypothetical protein E4Z66_15685 [Aliishimia ponticola]|uniref:Uncharacterized protein n=1 Tax=Aliishimia ponticola TaxID=2499833 RepID=A0A4S4N7V4_9RHOB|nr:hypothetical protein [Aliishimia ponticola]THH35262.1 hypothetical protein E4Z66_15685 [Aliishimia ponticola]